MIIATAGHVDHGKTSLVRALTGIDTDRLPEERRRGLTIELRYAYADWSGVGRPDGGASALSTCWGIIASSRPWSPASPVSTRP